MIILFLSSRQGQRDKKILKTPFRQRRRAVHNSHSIGNQDNTLTNNRLPNPLPGSFL